MYTLFKKTIFTIIKLTLSVIFFAFGVSFSEVLSSFTILKTVSSYIVYHLYLFFSDYLSTLNIKWPSRIKPADNTPKISKPFPKIERIKTSSILPITGGDDADEDLTPEEINTPTGKK